MIKKKNRLHWFAFDVDEWAATSCPLDDRGSGQLIQLMTQYWRAGRLPTDAQQLAIIAKARDGVLPEVLALFPEHDGWLTCPYLDQLRREAEKIRDSKRKGGRARHARPSTNGHARNRHDHEQQSEEEPF